ncbi:MAG: glycosyltransferase family 4 protein [Chloroflexota bacterium]
MGVMRILFVADGRSPTALNWISFFVEQGHEVHLVSTYSCDPEIDFASINIIPVALNQAASSSTSGGRGSLLKRITTPGFRTKLRQLLGPLTISGAAKRLSALVEELQPELVHAMRIPYEGMLAATAMKNSKIPLITSVWGNDFTLHANSSAAMRKLTRSTLARTNALHSDTQRDQKLARQWGFLAEKPSTVLPGGGGIRLEIFNPPSSPPASPTIINPRGVRAYIRNDTFFQAIPMVLEKVPEARFICPAMHGEKEAESWINKLNIASSVELLPQQSRNQMADLYRQAQIAVSLSEHDGTPNTLLEAMACGCFPIAGDIESLREWIDSGQNGLLVPYDDPQVLALAILQVLIGKMEISKVVQYNLDLVSQRAEYAKTMTAAQKFYAEISLS